MIFRNLPPSPWSVEGAVPGIEQESYEWILDQLEAKGKQLPRLTDREQAAIVQVIYAAMDYGWEAAAANARFRAVRRANSKRAAAADAKRDSIRATYDRLAKSGEVTIQAVAEACGVSVATAYRAMGEKKRRR